MTRLGASVLHHDFSYGVCSKRMTSTSTDDAESPGRKLLLTLLRSTVEDVSNQTYVIGEIQYTKNDKLMI